MVAQPGKPVTAGAANADELFRHIVESSTDFAIFTIDPGGRITSWNIGAQRLFGYAESEILDRPDELTFTPEDRAAGAPAHERRQAASLGRGLDERWHMRKDGSRFWASGLLMPLTNPSDGYLKITRDRTEQHAASERIRENEERFRLLATNIPQLVFLSRGDGQRSWASPQWCIFAGQSFEASVGSGWFDAIHPDDREGTRKAWGEAQLSGEYYFEHRVRRARDGEYRWHQTRARPIDPEDRAEGEWVGTMSDIHELRSLHDRQ